MEILWYNKHKGLQGSVLSKARKLCRLKRIERVDSNKWLVKHIEGYNKTDYDIVKEGDYSCNCQYFNKTGSPCSHIIAVELFEEGHPPISTGTSNNNNNNKNTYIYKHTYINK